MLERARIARTFGRLMTSASAASNAGAADQVEGVSANLLDQRVRMQRELDLSTGVGDVGTPPLCTAIDPRRLTQRGYHRGGGYHAGGGYHGIGRYGQG